jgi:hypothetical protein
VECSGSPGLVGTSEARSGQPLASERQTDT